MADELLPCPFCGASNATPVSNGYESHCINCLQCGAEGGSALDDAAAVAAWNMRAEPPAIPTGDAADSSWGEWQEAQG